MQHDTAPSTTPAIPGTAFHRLDAKALTVAVGFAMLDVRGDAETTQLARIQAALWRENPEEVAAIYHRLAGADWGRSSPHEGDNFGAPRVATNRPQHCKHGVTVRELADQSEVSREAMARALEHHGFLHLAPFGGRQSRRLVTEIAERAGYGHNADGAAAHIGWLEGFARASTFPVFYPDRLPEMLAVLDFPGIRQIAAAIPKKRDRLAWALTHHGYLPNDFLALLTGYTERGVKKARARSDAKVPSQVRYTEDEMDSDQRPAVSI